MLAVLYDGESENINIILVHNESKEMFKSYKEPVEKPLRSTPAGFNSKLATKIKDSSIMTTLHTIIHKNSNLMTQPATTFQIKSSTRIQTTKGITIRSNTTPIHGSNRAMSSTTISSTNDTKSHSTIEPTQGHITTTPSTRIPATKGTMNHSTIEPSKGHSRTVVTTNITMSLSTIAPTQRHNTKMPSGLSTTMSLTKTPATNGTVSRPTTTLDHGYIKTFPLTLVTSKNMERTKAHDIKSNSNMNLSATANQSNVSKKNQGNTHWYAEMSNSTTVQNPPSVKPIGLQISTTQTVSPIKDIEVASSTKIQAVTSNTPTGAQISTTVRRVSSVRPIRTKFYVCPEPTHGGIGNQMFEYASNYAVAKSKNMTVIVPPSFHLNKFFSLKAEIRKDAGSICKNATGRIAAYHIKYDPNLTHFKPDTDYRIGIYLQSWMYFDPVADDIREQFKFKSSIKIKAEQIINATIRKHKVGSRSKVVLVGIHNRRGDFVNNSFGYNVASPVYLRKAVAYFTQKFINVLFIVCTNDLKWTKDNMPTAVTVSYMENNAPEVDMSILTMCDHTIISVGTFGWWAAWLSSGGKSIFLKWPAIEGSKLRKHFSKDYSDFFPPGWIGISN